MTILQEGLDHNVFGKFMEPAYYVEPHDEAEVYGTPHTLVYARYEQPIGSVVISFTQGGALHKNEGRVHVRASDLCGLAGGEPGVFAEGSYPYSETLDEATARMIGDSLVKQIAEKI